MCGGRSSILHYGPLIETNNLYAPTPNGQSPSASLNKSNTPPPPGFDHTGAWLCQRGGRWDGRREKIVQIAYCWRLSYKLMYFEHVLLIFLSRPCFEKNVSRAKQTKEKEEIEVLSYLGITKIICPRPWAVRVGAPPHTRRFAGDTYTM